MKNEIIKKKKSRFFSYFVFSLFYFLLFRIHISFFIFYFSFFHFFTSIFFHFFFTFHFSFFTFHSSLFGQQQHQRGRSPVQHRGNLNVLPSVGIAIRTSPLPPSSQLHLLWGPNPAVWPKSKQNSPNSSKMV